MIRLANLSLGVVVRLAAALAAATLLVGTLLTPENVAVAPDAFVTIPNAQAAMAVKRMKLAPLDHWAEIIQRPLFHPDRRPWQPPPPALVRQAVIAPPRPPAPPNGWRLVGAVLDRSGRVAVLRSAQSDKARLVREGDVLDGWIVIAITHDQMTLALNTATSILALRNSK